MTTTAYGEYRSQYSSSVKIGYTSRNFTQEKNADFYGNVSAAAVKTTADNQSIVIGLTTIPYSNMMSYGMKAQYAPESTKENPVIQVTSNYGGETVSYNVNVNEVNPENASQLEMFALLSYADDTGISKGGTFGSYQQMKNYSYNACSNGYIAGYSESSFSSYETFMSGRFNWTGIISVMMEDYLSAGVYEQSQSCKNLLDVFEKFKTENFYEYEASQVESSETGIVKSAKSELDSLGPNAPEAVRNAWNEAAAETGTNGLGMNKNGMLSHISQMMVMSLVKWQNTGSRDILGSSVETALSAAQEALYNLRNPLPSDRIKSPEVMKARAAEEQFYVAFIEKLQAVKANSTKTTGSDSTVAEPEASDEEAGKESAVTDYLQLIRNKINEMYDKVKNNETEEKFQIGANSFTEKEWNKLLEEFDNIQETIRELMREEHEKRQAKQAEREELVDALVSESVMSKQDSENEEADKTLYITWYNEDGIFCRKAGVTEGYEWTINFDGSKQYQMVDEFMKQFDKDDNLRFASNQKFWQDFLGGTIEVNEFVKFFKETDNKASGYSRYGESVFADSVKAKWVPYMERTGHEITLDPNALLSICHVPTGETANVYKAEDFSESNPVYVVKGIDKNGKEYEQRIDANNINPTSCSYTEMLVWGVHSGNTSPKDYLAMARMRSEAGSNSYQTTINYLEIIQKLMGEMQLSGDTEHYLNYKKWFDGLTK